MHVVMLSDMEAFGGAAVSTGRLAAGLAGLGHRVTRAVATADGPSPDWATERLTIDLTLRELFVRRALPARAAAARQRRQAARRLDRCLTRLRPDVVNVHNIHLAATSAEWSIDLLDVCAAHAPVVWTLHDMWSFTGRCAYSYDCTRYRTGCDAACPTPTESPALAPAGIAPAWAARQRVLTAQTGARAVAPSRWLAAAATSGLWGPGRVSVIPYGVPLDVFAPVDRGVARAALGVHADGPVLLTAAESLTDRRKGGAILTDALADWSGPPLTLLTLGSGRLETRSPRVRVMPLGYVSHDRMKVLAYGAADLLVHPAPVDNLPNVVLEALACGTPVVALPVGGLPDMIRAGETGWLAASPDAAGLAAAVATALGQLGDRDWRATARAAAERDYPLRLQAERYAELFESLRDGPPAAGMVADERAVR